MCIQPVPTDGRERAVSSGPRQQRTAPGPGDWDIAQAYGKSAAQVVLRWHIQMGFCPVPGSKSPAHIQENGEIFDFALTPEEMERMAGINRHTPFYQVTPESLQRLAVTKCNFEE